MPLVKRTAQLFVGTASIFFLLVGLVVIAANIASLVTFVGELVPKSVAYAGLGVGAAIALVAVAGFVSICAKSHKRIWLSTFMTFDLLVFLVLAVLAFFTFKSNGALKELNDAAFTNVTDAMQTEVSKAVMNGVSSTYAACQADVSPAAPFVSTAGRYFHLTCNSTQWSMFASIVNDNCMAPEYAVLDFAAKPTNFLECFVDQSFWSAEKNGYVGPTTWLHVGQMVDTPKGVFCQCYQTLGDIFNEYFTIIAWSCVGVAAFFGLVFLASCYLCCCAKPAAEEDSRLAYNPYGPSGGYVARP